MDDAHWRTTIEAVLDPELGQTLGELRMLRSATTDASGTLNVDVELPAKAYPQPERLTAAIESAVKTAEPARAVRVQWQAVVRGKNTGGNLGLRVKNVIAVGSGKGGVGKSTVAASLAFGLQHLGATVGLLDADIYGPSIPHLVGSQGAPRATQQTGPNGEQMMRIVPVEAGGLKVISMAYFVAPEEAVIFRGPRLHGALTQFVRDVEWGELDYLIIDMPPGTGDIALTLSQMMGLAGAVVVCTPQEVALLDAVKAISMFRKVKIPVLGLVENMTGELFGRGGARRKAAELGIPCLGEIPAESIMRVRGDEGRLASLFTEDNPVRTPLLEICQRTAMEIVRQLQDTSAMPTLEIL